MTNRSLASSYLIKARKRLLVLQLLQREEAYSDVVREALLDPGQAMIVPADDTVMRPSLLPGDLMVVAPFLGLPREGQIVVARVSGRLAARRLAGVEMVAGRRRYKLRGEAVAARGEGVRREDLLGRVVAVVRHGLRMPVNDRFPLGAGPGRR